MAEFRAPTFGKWATLATFAFFGLVAVMLVASTVAGDGPPIAFSIVWLFGLAWGAYWWLFRIAVALRLDRDCLNWEAPLRSGSVLLSDIDAVRPMRLASNIEVFEQREGRPVVILAAKGLRAFVDELSVYRPDVPVRWGWQGRLAEWMPGRSGWRKRPFR